MFGATTSYSFSMVPQLVDTRDFLDRSQLCFVVKLDHRRVMTRCQVANN